MRSDTVGRPMEILLVEDSLSSARLTMGVLRHSGLAHRMTWLSDGIEAIEFLRQEGKYRQAPQPDLMLLDLGLPRKDGREVLTEIRAGERFRELPVVILTASTADEDMHRSESLHVQGYMTKPVDMNAFMDLVHELRRYWKSDMILPAT